ncbi:MAG: clostripain-related cysteine peptidase, partial [Candidatus Hadarchaeales archaeon]
MVSENKLGWIPALITVLLISFMTTTATSAQNLLLGLAVTPTVNKGGVLTTYTVQFTTGTNATENVENIEIEFAPQFGIWKTVVTSVENIKGNGTTTILENKVIYTLPEPENIAGKQIKLVLENVRNPAPGTYDVVVRTITTGGNILGENSVSVTIERWTDWTIMVYLDADCDLEDWGYNNFNAMELPESPGANILVLFDTWEWENTYIYYVVHDDTKEIGSQLLENMSENNMGDPVTLVNFIKYGIEKYPATHYAVILWDHGGGWMILPYYESWFRSGLSTDMREVEKFLLDIKNGGIKRDNFRGLCWDLTDDDWLTMSELKEAIENATRDTGKNIDLLGFDACLMQMLEVAYQVKDNVRIMVASQEVEPAPGWPYENILNTLASNPSMSPENLARAIVNNYAAYYEGSEFENYYTMSAIDLSKVGELATKLDNLARILKGKFENYAVEMHEKRYKTASFYLPYYADLYDFASRLKEIGDPEITGAVQALIGSIQQAVIAENHGKKAGGIYYPWTKPNIGHENAVHGISIYHPFSACVYELINEWRENYENEVALATDTQWDEFLSNITPVVQLLPSEGTASTTIQAYGLAPYAWSWCDEIKIFWDGKEIPLPYT